MHLTEQLIEINPKVTSERIERQKHTLEQLMLRFEHHTDDVLLKADIGRAHQKLGESLRLTQNYNESCQHFDAAHRIWVELQREKATFLTSLKIALVAFRHEGKLKDLAILTEQAKTVGDGCYLDYTLDIATRIQFTLDNQDLAKSYAQQALEIQQRNGRPQKVTDRTLFILDCIDKL